MMARPGGGSFSPEDSQAAAVEEDFQRLVFEQCTHLTNLPTDVLRSLLQTLDPTGRRSSTDAYSRALMIHRVGFLVLATVQVGMPSVAIAPCHRGMARKRMQRVSATLTEALPQHPPRPAPPPRPEQRPIRPLPQQEAMPRQRQEHVQKVQDVRAIVFRQQELLQQSMSQQQQPEYRTTPTTAAPRIPAESTNKTARAGGRMAPPGGMIHLASTTVQGSTAAAPAAGLDDSFATNFTALERASVATTETRAALEHYAPAVALANPTAPTAPSANNNNNNSTPPALPPLDTMSLSDLATELLDIYKVDVDDFIPGSRYERAVQVLKEKRAAHGMGAPEPPLAAVMAHPTTPEAPAAAHRRTSHPTFVRRDREAIMGDWIPRKERLSGSSSQGRVKNVLGDNSNESPLKIPMIDNRRVAGSHAPVLNGSHRTLTSPSPRLTDNPAFAAKPSSQPQRQHPPTALKPADQASPPQLSVIVQLPRRSSLKNSSVQAKTTTTKVQFSLPGEKQSPTVATRRESVATQAVTAVRQNAVIKPHSAPATRSPIPTPTTGRPLHFLSPHFTLKLAQAELQIAIQSWLPKAPVHLQHLLQTIAKYEAIPRERYQLLDELNYLRISFKVRKSLWNEIKNAEYAALAKLPSQTRILGQPVEVGRSAASTTTKTLPTENSPQEGSKREPPSQHLGSRHRVPPSSHSDGDHGVSNYGPSDNKQTIVSSTAHAPLPRETGNRERTMPQIDPLEALHRPQGANVRECIPPHARWQPPSSLTSRAARKEEGEVSGRSNDTPSRAVSAELPLRHPSMSEISNSAPAKIVTLKVLQEAPRPFARTDGRSASRSIPLKVMYNESSVKNEQRREVAMRWNEWEPFWEAVGWVNQTITNPVCDPLNEPAAKTAFWARLDSTVIHSHKGKIAGMTNIKQDEWGMARTAEPYEDGETRLLLFTLPVVPPKMKRADGHVWPIGTFLQLTTTGHLPSTHPIHLKQRSETNQKKWTGMCDVLDLTQHIKDPTKPTKIEAITHDGNPFYACAVYAKYRSSVTLFNLLMDDKSPDSIRKLTEEEGLKKVQCLFSLTVVLDDSDNEDGGETEEAGKYILSLKDAFSAKLINTPVRGKDCAHFQCFDLMTFLEGNSVVSGNRWRCLSCEKFISWSNLEYCGFTAKLLGEFASDASSSRNRVEVTSSGSYRLLEETSRKRKKMPPITNNNDSRSSRKARFTAPEIFDCEVLVL